MTSKGYKKKVTEEKAREPAVTAPVSYRVLVGVNFPSSRGKSRRIEPGQVVDDLPERVIETLLEQRAIEEVK